MIGLLREGRQLGLALGKDGFDVLGRLNPNEVPFLDLLSPAHDLGEVGLELLQLSERELAVLSLSLNVERNRPASLRTSLNSAVRAVEAASITAATRSPSRRADRTSVT